MAKIRITQPTFDQVTKEHYIEGRILDLGAIRNRNAVNSNQAVWVDSEKYEKELSKADAPKDGEPVIMSEKVEVPRVAKKTGTSVRGKKIETKK